jgi:hypothetical protein
MNIILLHFVILILIHNSWGILCVNWLNEVYKNCANTTMKCSHFKKKKRRLCNRAFQKIMKVNKTVRSIIAFYLLHMLLQTDKLCETKVLILKITKTLKLQIIEINF